LARFAVAPSDPNIVAVGTGESWVIRYSDVMGDGVYVSRDAGKTWKNVGLQETGRISRVIIHPTDPNIMYVCAAGRMTGPQEERGIFKTTDGGGNWQRVGFVDPKTGCSGLSMDAEEPEHPARRLLAGEQHTWGQFSGGPGSGVYLTKDGGAKWTKLTSGLPKPDVGKIDVQIAPSDSNRMYALIQTKDQGSVWRSDDAGATWKVVSWDRSLIGRAGYYIRMVVNPQNPDDIFIMSSSMHRSQDGGKSFSGNGGQFAFTQGQASCGDCHDVWIDPKDPNATPSWTTAAGRSTRRTARRTLRIPNGQMYHVHVDNQVPYWIYSNRQDDGTMRGPSTSSETAGNGCLPENSTMPANRRVRLSGRGRGGGGGGPRDAAAARPRSRKGAVRRASGRGRTAAGDALAAQHRRLRVGLHDSRCPTIPDVVYASCYGNKVTRWDARTGTGAIDRAVDGLARLASQRGEVPLPLDLADGDRSVRHEERALRLPADPEDVERRPVVDRAQPRSLDEGSVARRVQRRPRRRQPGPVQRRSGVVHRVLEDQAGTDLGRHQRRQALVHRQQRREVERRHRATSRTCRCGARSTDLAVDVRSGGSLRRRLVSPDGRSQAVHLQDDRLRQDVEEDQRQHPDRPSARLQSCRCRATRIAKGMLFAGSARAFYYSMDDGGTWTRFKDGLPPAPVSWITVEPRFHDVVISTYGRGLYILPNITLLEQSGNTTAPPPSTTKLYEPAPLFRQARSVFQQANRPHFQLALANAPSGPVKMEILDSGGKVLRTQMVTAARRAERLLLGSAARRAEAGRADDHAARQPAHLGRRTVQGRAGPPHHALGDHAADRRPDGGARQVPGALHG
jgi:hypothetical protein